MTVRVSTFYICIYVHVLVSVIDITARGLLILNQYLLFSKFMSKFHRPSFFSCNNDVSDTKIHELGWGNYICWDSKASRAGTSIQIGP